MSANSSQKNKTKRKKEKLSPNFECVQNFFNEIFMFIEFRPTKNTKVMK